MAVAGLQDGEVPSPTPEGAARREELLSLSFLSFPTTGMGQRQRGRCSNPALSQDTARHPAQGSGASPRRCLWVPVCGVRPFPATAQLEL